MPQRHRVAKDLVEVNDAARGRKLAVGLGAPLSSLTIAILPCPNAPRTLVPTARIRRRTP
jgi:hypothetical protein